ncbi:MAG: TIGR00725 family protein [Anaerolineae bacterium]
MLIGVIGVAEATPAQEHMAELVGALIAEAGHVLVCGGRGGVMAAACRGAARSGGQTLGILPGDTADEANTWVTIPLPTGMGEARNALIARAADALIAIGTGWGTLSEMALAVKMGKPVIALGAAPFLQDFAGDAVRWVETPVAAVELALTLADSSAR